MSSLPASARSSTSISNEEARAALLAAISGTIFVGMLLEMTARSLGVRALGATVGAGYPTGWLVLLALSGAFSLLFVEFLSRTIDSFVTQVIATTSQQELLRKALVPLLRRAALTVTAVTLGLAYGLVVAIAFHVVLLPGWLNVVGTSAPFPNVDVLGALVWVAYGVLLGGFYGQLMAR